MKFCNIYALIVILTLAGCSTLKSVPPGTSIQSSTTGIKISPFSVDGTPLTLGSHTFILTTPTPAGSGANLNRFAVEVPGGISLKSTVATGSVGDELQKAGGPEALKHLLGTPSDTSGVKAPKVIPLPLTQPIE